MLHNFNCCYNSVRVNLSIVFLALEEDRITGTEKEMDFTTPTLLPILDTHTERNDVILHTDASWEDIDNFNLLKDGTEVDISDDKKYELVNKDGKISLIIKDDIADDVGQYTCSVTRPDGTTRPVDVLETVSGN